MTVAIQVALYSTVGDEWRWRCAPDHPWYNANMSENSGRLAQNRFLCEVSQSEIRYYGSLCEPVRVVGLGHLQKRVAQGATFLAAFFTLWHPSRLD